MTDQLVRQKLMGVETQTKMSFFLLLLSCNNQAAQTQMQGQWLAFSHQNLETTQAPQSKLRDWGHSMNFVQFSSISLHLIL